MLSMAPDDDNNDDFRVVSIRESSKDIGPDGDRNEDGDRDRDKDRDRDENDRNSHDISHLTNDDHEKIDNKNSHDEVKELTNIIHVTNVHNSTGITVKYHKKSGRFAFYNGEVPLGSFNGIEFIKYVVSPLISKSGNGTIGGGGNFMIDTDMSSFELIKKYVCTTEPYALNHASDGDVNTEPFNIIIFVSHLESPFTGDLKMLFSLYKQIEIFEKNRLDIELEKIEFYHRVVVKKAFVKINYAFLTHILKIISMVSEIIKSDQNISLNKQLMKYSKFSILKLLDIFREAYQEEVNKNKALQEGGYRIKEERNNLMQKLDNIEKYMMAQQLNIMKGAGMKQTETETENEVECETENETQTSQNSENESESVNNNVSETTDALSGHKDGVSTSTSLGKMDISHLTNDDFNNGNFKKHVVSL